MKEPKQISRNKPLPRIQDYAWLRERAVEIVQRYSSDHWTDYNEHDPGMTILEALCYLITDIGYRIHHPYIDLIAPNEPYQKFYGEENSFYSPRDILHNAPLSPQDFRSMLLDIPGLRNAWVKSTTGHSQKSHSFKVSYILESFLTSRQQKEVKEEMAQILLENRNLGMGMPQMLKLEPRNIWIKTKIVIDESLDPNEVMAEILFQLYYFFNPDFRFYSATELLRQDIPTDEIFQGPALRHGFLLEKDLFEDRDYIPVPSPNDWDNSIKELQVVLKDFLQNRDEVLWVEKLEIEKNSTSDPNQALKLLPSADDYFLNFNLWLNQLVSSKSRSGSGIFTEHLQNTLLISNGQLCKIRSSKVREILEEKVMSNSRRKARAKNRNTDQNFLDFPIPVGTYKDLYTYRSIQYDFPGIYQLYPSGNALDLNIKGRVHIFQLRAYLLFFEQMAQNHLLMLDGIKYFFKVSADSISNPLPITFKGLKLPIPGPYYPNWEKEIRSYFPPAISSTSFIPGDFPEFWKLIKYPPLVNLINKYESSTESDKKQLKRLKEEAEAFYQQRIGKMVEQPEDTISRLGIMLNFMLGSVGLRFDENLFQMYSSFSKNDYGSRINFVKRRILLNYPSISSDRALAFDLQKISSQLPSDIISTDEKSLQRGNSIGLIDYLPLAKLLQIQEENDTAPPQKEAGKTYVRLNWNVMVELTSENDFDELLDYQKFLKEKQDEFELEAGKILLKKEAGKIIVLKQDENHHGMGLEVINPFNVSGFKLRLCHLLGIDYWQNWKLSSFYLSIFKKFNDQVSFPDLKSVKEVFPEDKFNRICEAQLGFSFELDENKSISQVINKIFLHGMEKKKYKITSIEGNSVNSSSVQKDSTSNDKPITSYLLSLHDSPILDDKSEIARVASTFIDPHYFPSYLETNEAKFKLANHLKQLKNKAEGFYEIEGNLLREKTLKDFEIFIPINNNDLKAECSAPEAIENEWQYEIFLLFPDWPARFQSEGFKEVLYQKIHRELSAHLIPVVIWMDFEEMQAFELLYEKWLFELNEVQLRCKELEKSLNKPAQAKTEKGINNIKKSIALLNEASKILKKELRQAQENSLK
ncbi:MAG: hypothetical protein MRZ79_09115 [Bacteroidia bacterium]|nr:hypothetical protein [Bacteroidia bacterium]